MNRLPYIDRHVRRIDAPPEQVWRALLATLRRSPPQPPSWLSGVWGLEYRARAGSWAEEPEIGDTVPGFSVRAVDPPRLLALRGRHRFSEYELRFELERSAAGGSDLRATTDAAFPGVKGRVYRRLVIGSGAHQIAVRRILAAVAGRARIGDPPAGLRLQDDAR